MSGEYPPVGRGLQLRVVKVAAILHDSFEPGVGILNDRIQRGAGFGTGRFETVRRRLERRRFHRFDFHAKFVEKIGDVWVLKQHADRADQRGLLRHDVVACKRGDIAAGSRHAVDHHDQRFLLTHPRQRVEQLLRTGRGAAGAVNVDDDRARQVRPRQPVKLFGAILIAPDQARDGQACDVGADAKTIIAVAGQSGRAGNTEHDQDNRRDPPEGELPPHATAINDEIGIKRHGFYPYLRFLSEPFLHRWHAPPVPYSASSLSPVSLSSPLRLSAVPRMSPKVAPESDEPYWAIASFSSATSSALIETDTRRERRSNWVTRASTFSPTAKRSGRCSERSRASSERLMKAVNSVPTILTSMPPSFTSVISQVTTAPFFRSPAAGSAAAAPSESCLIPSEMRSFSTSTSSTCALTLSPFLYSSMTCSPGRFQSRSDKCTMPSTSPSSPRNSPNSVLFLTSPSTFEPGGYFSRNTSHGLRMVCFRPSEMRRLTGSTSRT